MIQDAIIELLLNSGDFLARISDLIISRIWPEGEEDEEAEVDIDELFTALESKIVSLVDTRIHGMEKRLNAALASIEASIKDEISRTVAPAAPVAPPEPPAQPMNKEVVPTLGFPRRTRPRRR